MANHTDDDYDDDARAVVAIRRSAIASTQAMAALKFTFASHKFHIIKMMISTYLNIVKLLYHLPFQMLRALCHLLRSIRTPI